MLVEGLIPNKKQHSNDEESNLSAKEVCDTVVFKIKNHFVLKAISVKQRYFSSNTSVMVVW